MDEFRFESEPQDHHDHHHCAGEYKVAELESEEEKEQEPTFNFQQAPRPRNLPMQSSRSNVMKSHPDLPNVIEEDEHDDAETVYSEFEYSVRDGIRFLKSTDIDSKNEALDRLVKSVYDSARRERSKKSSHGEEKYSSDSATPSDAFHHGLDKDELMSMVAVLTKQSTFSDMLYNQHKTSTPSSSTQLNRQTSFHSTAGKSRAGESKASSMPSLTECSSLASSVSRAFSRSVNSRTPVINKNQLFAMRKEQRVHADSLPQQPSRQRTEFSDCESMMSEDDLESIYSHNSALESITRSSVPPPVTPFAMHKRPAFDHVPQQPSRRFTEYSDVESSGEDEGSVRSRGSQLSRRRRRADRMPRFPTRSCASLASCDDDKSICTMTRVEEEEELHEDAPISVHSAGTSENTHRGCPDSLPRMPSPSCTPGPTPDSSARLQRTVLDSVPPQPATDAATPAAGTATMDATTTSGEEDHSEEYWEFPNPTPIKKKRRLRLKKQFRKIWKSFRMNSKASEEQAKIVEDFLPKKVSESPAATAIEEQPKQVSPRINRFAQPQSSVQLTVAMDETSVQGSFVSLRSHKSNAISV
jgi:hypothetical protein